MAIGSCDIAVKAGQSSRATAFITRRQAGRFRQAKNEPSARRSLAGGCCGHKFFESRDERELGYASLESKSEIPVEVTQAMAISDKERRITKLGSKIVRRVGSINW